jgi:hypothetical protein
LRLYIVFFVLLVLSSAASAEERVLNMSVTATVNSDASVTVVESMTVEVENNILRNGLIRVFQNVFRDQDGKIRRAKLELLSARIDGSDIPARLRYVEDDVEVIIGGPAYVGAIGTHKFDLAFRALGWVDFGRSADGLSMMLLDRRWLTTEKANFKIILPPGGGFINRTILINGDHAKNPDIKSNMMDELEIARPILAGESLAVNFTWPRGIVSEPKVSIFDSMIRYIDTLSATNLLTITFVFCAGIFICYCVLMYVQKQASGE